MLFSKIIEKKFDAVLGRYNGSLAEYYFSPKDFPEIKAEKFDVNGSEGVLKGNFYFYNEFNPQKFIIFDHGIGSGHLAYFKEIEMLAKNGYTVYSYDHTGCVESDGKGILGFAQGVNDLDCVVTAIEKDGRFKDSKIKVIGHSWGGYSAMNVLAFHPEITHVVSLAGFVSAQSLIEQYLPNFVMKYSKEVMDRERKHNPKYADLNALDSIKKSDAKLMYLQSRDDIKVKFDTAFVPLNDAFKNRKDTVFIEFNNRNHSPNYTDEAVVALTNVVNTMEELKKKKKLNTESEQIAFRDAQNWDLITKQDIDVWNKIFAFLAD